MRLEEVLFLMRIEKMLMRGEGWNFTCFSHVEDEHRAKRHAEFFKGLSPREEYTKHAEFRKTIDEF